MEPGRETGGRRRLLSKKLFLCLGAIILLGMCVNALIFKHWSLSGLPWSSTVTTTPFQYMEAVCLGAPHKHNCMSVISEDEAGKLATSRVDVLVVAVRQAMATSDILNRQYFFKNMGVNGTLDVSKKDPAVEEECGEMFELIRANLEDLMHGIVSSGGVDGLTKLDSLINNALTYQYTCINDYKEAHGSSMEFLMEQKRLHDLLENCRWLLMESAEAVETPRFGPAWLMTETNIPSAYLTVEVNLTVAKDGSGDYRTISEAIERAPFHSKRSFVIKIKSGVYEEYVLVPKDKTNIKLIGESRLTTVITGNRFKRNNNDSTANTGTLIVGGKGFTGEELTIMNTAGPERHQASAVVVLESHVAFYRCNITGYQDTLYVKAGTQFYRHCIIEGTVDFIFGRGGAAVFQDCQILVKRPMENQKNLVTADGPWSAEAATAGISIQRSIIGATPDLDWTHSSTHSTYLGRPWSMFARTAFMGCYLGHVIHPHGLMTWADRHIFGKTKYIEYMNIGPGADTSNRVKWLGYESHPTLELVKSFSARVLIKGEEWLPQTGFPFDLDVVI